MPKLAKFLLALAVALCMPVLIARLVLRSRGDEFSDEIDLVAVGSAVSLRPRSSNFLGGNCLAVLGSMELDLRQTLLAPTGAELNLVTVAASIRLIIPEGWRATVHGRRVASAVRQPAVSASLDPPHLDIRASTYLGRLEVAAKPLEAVPA